MGLRFAEKRNQGNAEYGVLKFISTRKTGWNFLVVSLLKMTYLTWAAYLDRTRLPMPQLQMPPYGNVRSSTLCASAAVGGQVLPEIARRQ